MSIPITKDFHHGLLACIIGRISHYRLLAPIVDSALARGWNGECWHDTSHPREGTKGYLFPELTAAPRFFNGQPTFVPFDGCSQLSEYIRKRRPNVIVSLEPPPACYGSLGPNERPKWVIVQHAVDTFLTYTPSELLSCDVAAIYSKWWIKFAGRHYAEEGQVSDRLEFERAFAGTAQPVGFPALDAAARIVPLEVRRRWGIPTGQPVVVLLPFPQGVGKGAFWPKLICMQPSRLRRASNVIAHRRFDYLSDIWHDCTDASVVKAIRAFCNRNGAYLLVKSRKKTPIPDYTRAVADKCLYDEQFYPATILEALSIASVCVNFFSGAVSEAIAFGVPNVCITFSADDYNGRNRLLLDRHRRYHTAEEGSPFRFAGVSTTMTMAEAIEVLPRRDLDSFAMDATARQRYIDKYLSFADACGAERLLDQIDISIVRDRVGNNPVL